MSGPTRAAPRRAAPPRPAPAARARARTLVARLAKAHPDWGPTLEFADPLQLLVATILAAQAQDERINAVTRTVIFPKYRTAADYANADRRVLERELRPTGFFRQKAKAVQAAAQGIVERFGGTVPDDLEGLTSLHGVGRKTAAIVLGNAFGVPAVAVDRHVARVAGRLGLSRQTDPDRIEADLRALLPARDWVRATWCLVLHGRRICTPTPRCPECPVREACPYPKKVRARAVSVRAAPRATRPPSRRGAAVHRR